MLWLVRENVTWIIASGAFGFGYTIFLLITRESVTRPSTSVRTAEEVAAAEEPAALVTPWEVAAKLAARAEQRGTVAVAQRTRPSESIPGDPALPAALHAESGPSSLPTFPSTDRAADPLAVPSAGPSADEVALAEERKRLEAERAELERERIERERAELVAERRRIELERERRRAEQERQVAERVEFERLAAERAEFERAEAERVRLEAERLAAEKAEAERAEAERRAEERAAALADEEAARAATEAAEAEQLLDGSDAVTAAAELHVEAAGLLDATWGHASDEDAESPLGAGSTYARFRRKRAKEVEFDLEPTVIALAEPAEAPVAEPLEEEVATDPVVEPEIDIFAAYTVKTPPVIEQVHRPAVVAEVVDADAVRRASYDVDWNVTPSYDTDSHMPFGPGSLAPRLDGMAPAGHPIKGNLDTMLFHTTASRWFNRIKADVWFETEALAQRAGFTRWDQRGSAATAMHERRI